jgi:hypothetical protein
MLSRKEYVGKGSGLVHSRLLNLGATFSTFYLAQTVGCQSLCCNLENLAALASYSSVGVVGLWLRVLCVQPASIAAIWIVASISIDTCTDHAFLIHAQGRLSLNDRMTMIAVVRTRLSLFRAVKSYVLYT